MSFDTCCEDVQTTRESMRCGRQDFCLLFSLSKVKWHVFYEVRCDFKMKGTRKRKNGRKKEKKVPRGSY